jgi:hypothetical protein
LNAFGSALQEGDGTAEDGRMGEVQEIRVGTAQVTLAFTESRIMLLAESLS